MKVYLFGGTREGRALAALHAARGDEVLVSVTSEYARALLPAGVACTARPMDEAQMEAAVRAFAPDLLIDATHPFARSAHENIAACARALGLALKRADRDSDAGSDFADRVSWADGAEEAARMLAGTRGRVLLTTGSHTARAYLDALGGERLFLRVLPASCVLREMEDLGLPPGHLIAMQGPFTEHFNAALYEMLDIRHLVSKDSGAAGGVREKVLPALARGIGVILIRRPRE